MTSPARELLLFDRTLLYALASRLWQALSGPITIVVIIGLLTVEEQGRYYSLATLMSLQVFFELGLLNVLISQASYLNHQLSWGTRHQPMLRLIELSSRWFGIVAILFLITSVGIGWWMLLQPDGAIDWQLPLISLGILSAATVALSPRLALLEGSGFRQNIYGIRFLQLVTGSLAVWIALLLGLKLWALVVSASVQLLWTIAVLFFVYRPWVQSLSSARQVENGLPVSLREIEEPKPNSTHLLTWFADVLPKQWPSAVISLATHAATQFLGLITLVFHGQAEAGRVGMTLTVTAAIQGLALSWLQTKFAIISAMCSQKQFAQAKSLWRQSVRISMIMLIANLLAFTFLLMLLPLANQGWETRFIQPFQLVWLSVGMGASQLLVCQNYFVLASNRQPLWRASLLGHGITLISVILAGRQWGTDGMVIAFALTAFLITLPLHTRDFLLQQQSCRDFN